MLEALPKGVLLPSVRLKPRWRARLDPELRARLMTELNDCAWAFSEMEALLVDAHRVTGLSHAFLAPSLEMRLPLFDLGRRFRVVMTRLDKTRVALYDEDNNRVLDLSIE